jgi:hypothetical protein
VSGEPTRELVILLFMFRRFNHFRLQS